MSVTHVASAAEFGALLAAHEYVVVDFSAEWCGPCKAIAPLYAKLAAEHARAGRLALAKIDVDAVPDVARAHNVSAMPTFLFFAGGRPASVNVAPRKPGATAEAEEADPAAKNVQNQIRGADPRALTAAVLRLSEAAQAEAAPAPA